MTDRVRCLIVQLDKDMRVDDAGDVVKAILALRHVYSVRTGEPVGLPDLSAREAAKQEIRDQMKDILWPPLDLLKR